MQEIKSGLKKAGQLVIGIILVVWVLWSAIVPGGNPESGFVGKTDPEPRLERRPLYTNTDNTYHRDDDYSTERSYEEYGDYDCSDFYSQSDAQDFFESEGGPSSDYHNLDRDGNGIACEDL